MQLAVAVCDVLFLFEYTRGFGHFNDGQIGVSAGNKRGFVLETPIFKLPD